MGYSDTVDTSPVAGVADLWTGWKRLMRCCKVVIRVGCSELTEAELLCQAASVHPADPGHSSTFSTEEETQGRDFEQTKQELRVELQWVYWAQNKMYKHAAINVILQSSREMIRLCIMYRNIHHPVHSEAHSSSFFHGVRLEDGSCTSASDLYTEM